MNFEGTWCKSERRYYFSSSGHWKFRVRVLVFGFIDDALELCHRKDTTSSLVNTMLLNTGLFKI